MHVSHGAKFIHAQQESCHIIPCGVACAMNSNDLMCASCNMLMLASQLSLDIYDLLEITYWLAIHVSETTSTKINCFTFLGPK